MSEEITQAQKTALLKIPGIKEIQKQYAKEQQAGGGKRRMKGRGFWQDVGNWFSQAGKDINQFLKDSKIVSKIANVVLPVVAGLGAGLLTANPVGIAAGAAAGSAGAEWLKSQGYGSKMSMKGRGISGTLQPIVSKEEQKLSQQRILNTGLNVLKKIAGKGIFPLAINQPGQRMRGINPKSKMRGAGYGTTNNTIGINGVPQKATAPAHSGMVRNMGGKGKGMPGKMMGMGGTEFNTVSSEFGNVQF
jgi:hypothetical protein